jgi:magnesium-transporting ATPase (P-type)
LWSNTVLATSGYILASVIYTGKETRSEMNSKEARVKIGKFDLEVNRLCDKLVHQLLQVRALAFCYHPHIAASQFRHGQSVLLLHNLQRHRYPRHNSS